MFILFVEGDLFLQVTVTPTHKSVPIGIQTKIFCNVTSNEPYNITWSHRKEIIFRLPPNTEIKDHHMLIIKHAMPYNEGIYVCIASVGSYIKKSVATLIVMKP